MTRCGRYSGYAFVREITFLQGIPVGQGFSTDCTGKTMSWRLYIKIEEALREMCTIHSLNYFS